jgi:hypothetical protein
VHSHPAAQRLALWWRIHVFHGIVASCSLSVKDVKRLKSSRTPWEAWVVEDGFLRNIEYRLEYINTASFSFDGES